MKKISIIAKSKEERELLKKELKNFDIIVDVADGDIERFIDENITASDKVILFFDAVEGMNPQFAYSIRLLYKKGIKPIILISNADHEEANLEVATNAIEEVLIMENPSLEAWELNFKKIYYNNKTNSFSTNKYLSDEGIEVLLEAIKE